MKKLTRNEEIFLLMIWHLKDEAYGVQIRKKIKEMTGENVLFGTIYNTLEYLFKKGYVDTRKGEPNERRGGHNKVFYSITNDGKAALQHARELENKLWNGVPDFVITEE